MKKMSEKKKIIIVGGGISGLTAGVYAQKLGFDSVIYEKHQIPGGQCTGWDRQGYHIDNCIHWMTGTKEGNDLHDDWVTLGALGDVEIYQPKSFGTYEIDGKRVTIWNNPERLEEELIEIAPEDTKRIKRFISDIKIASDMFMPTKVPMEMMDPKEGMKMLFSMRKAMMVQSRTSKISCKEYADTYQSQIMKKLFVAYMPPDYSLMSLVFSLATIASGDGGVPKYVSRSMAQRIAERYRSMGGSLQLGQGVEQILIKDDRAYGIQLQNGEQIMGDYVVPACDVHFTIETLLKNRYHIEEYENRYKDYITYPTPTSVLVGIGVEADLSDYPDSFSWECSPFKVGNSVISRIAYKNYAYEKTFAPEGCTTITMNLQQFDQDYLVWKELYQDQEAYKKEKDRIGQFVKSEVERVNPELKGKIHILDVATPVTYERYCNAYHGAWMTFILRPRQKRLTFNGMIDGLSNCYLAGQWMISPGGLPGAVNSGKSAIQRICKAEGMPML